MTDAPTHHRGIALIEAIVALLIVALVLLTATHFLQRLRLLGDVSRERTEATRLADAELERLQALDTPASVAALADRDEAIAGRASTARFDLQRRVAHGAAGTDVRAVTVAMQWTDRTGATQRVELPALVGPQDARLSAALVAGAAASAPRGVQARQAAIPTVARDLGDGRSAYTPPEAGAPTWIFDNASGAIVARCANGTTGCATVSAVSVSGTVRFDARDVPDATTARSAPLAFAIGITGLGAPACSITPVDASGDRFVRYVCIVDLGVAPSWSGRIELVPAGWTIGTTAGDHRVCRYAAVAPAAHTGIAVSLTHRDFLVVRGDLSCPAAILEASASAVDRRTVPHQP